MGSVMRATHLPDGTYESDSHHSFSLALVSYHIVKTSCPELDADRVMLFALAHDLLEIITGDEDTLHYTPKQHDAKHIREEAAVNEFQELFVDYPDILKAMNEYEKLDTPEAATVFVLDKVCTTWTWLHHPDMKNHAVERGINSKADVEDWSNRQREKLAKRLHAQPPQAVLDVYASSFELLKERYDS